MAMRQPPPAIAAGEVPGAAGRPPCRGFGSSLARGANMPAYREPSSAGAPWCGRPRKRMVGGLRGRRRPLIRHTRSGSF